MIFAPAAFGQAAPTAPQLQSQLQNLLQQLQQLQGQLPPGGAQALSTVVIPTLTRNLGLGSTDATTGGEVSQWQAFIVAQNKGQAAFALKHAFDDIGVRRGFFGTLTGRATQEWQTSQGITPTCQCVGPRTRAAVANLGQSQEQLRVVTPNGGEILNIGQTYRIHWTGPAVIPQGYSLVFSLIGGPTTGTIVTSGNYTNKQLDWQIDTVCPSDVCTQIQPGNYKIKAVLYDDGYLCLGFCPGPSPGQRPAQIVAQDESDATFSIVASTSPAPSPSPSPSPSLSPTSSPTPTSSSSGGGGSSY